MLSEIWKRTLDMLLKWNDASEYCHSICVSVCQLPLSSFFVQEKNKSAALELATLLLSMPTPAGVQQQTKGLLASLHTSRTAYHNHKVQTAVIKQFCSELAKDKVIE